MVLYAAQLAETTPKAATMDPEQLFALADALMRKTPDDDEWREVVAQMVERVLVRDGEIDVASREAYRSPLTLAHRWRRSMKKSDLAPRRDEWGLPTCFHRIECPVSTCEWTNSRLEGFITVAIEELEDHLWEGHRSKVHLTPHGTLDREPLAHSIRCDVFGAVFDEGLLTDGELNIRLTHHRVAQEQRRR